MLLNSAVRFIRKYATGEHFGELLLSIFEDVSNMMQKCDEPIDVIDLMICLVYNIFGQITMGKR